MLSLELIIPHFWGNPFEYLIHYEVFLSCWGEKAVFTVPCECQVLLPLSLWVILSQALASFLTCICWSVLTRILKRGPSVDLCGSFFMQLFPLSCSTLKTPVTLASLDSQLCLLNSGSMLTSTWVVPLLPQPGNSPKKIILGNCKVHLICSLSFRDYYTLLPDI